MSCCREKWNKLTSSSMLKSTARNGHKLQQKLDFREGFIVGVVKHLKAASLVQDLFSLGDV